MTSFVTFFLTVIQDHAIQTINQKKIQARRDAFGLPGKWFLDLS
jgi:hypothetical protein